MNDPNALCPEAFTGLSVTPPKETAVGLTAVTSSLAHVWGQAGLFRGTKVLYSLNQIGGVDCPSCAWPDPQNHRSFAEFCENGAKAVAWEADSRKLSREVFRKHSIDDLAKMSDYEHGQLGRLTEPMILRNGSKHYEPIDWEHAFALIATTLDSLDSPDEAIFYTSGRASNEAAFLFQLLARKFGTNNMPDCSNMCHESSGSALNSTIGIGKGTVTLEDFEKTELILIMGQNPGTNHPRMLTALQKAKREGAKIIAVNPLREAGLLGFRNPQEVGGILGLSRTQLADDYFQVKLGGDQALLQGVMKCLVSNGKVDRNFVDHNTSGYAELAAHLDKVPWDTLVSQSGITKERIEELAERIGKTERFISCWAMGLTQHRHSVAMIRDLVNLTLLRGSIGKPGAGLCPVRGHSNVQGDRTMGIFEKPPAWTEKLGEKYSFTSPKKVGYDTVEAIRAMRDGKAKLFFALGGNFLSATPDTEATAQALLNCDLTAHVSIKLNRSHLVPGKTALILPCLGRTERDIQKTGPQFVTTENSMGVVQRSQGTLEPASPQLLSEPVIIARLAQATFHEVEPWESYIGNYDTIRDAIEAVIPGFESYNARVREPGGFALPNGPREGKFTTPSGKAKFSVSVSDAPQPEAGQLVMMTIRSHDQFNTTVYGLQDRYRGIHNERRVIFMNEQDIHERGLKEKDIVNLVSHFKGETRKADHFLVVPYDIPVGNCATYFPETNVLVPLGSTALESNTPVSKAVMITLEKA